MKRVPVWLCLPLFLFLSCTSSQSGSSLVNASSDRYESYNNNPPQDRAIARFIVSPELGIVNGTINSTANSFVEVAELLTVNLDKLEKSISPQNGCSFNLINYQHPVAVGSRKSIASATKRYSGSLEFEVLISLAEAKNIKQRIQQINNCLQAVPVLKLDETQKDRDMSVNLSLSRVLLTVKNAGRYRQRLLEFKLQPYKEVASLSNPAIQFDAADTKCTSKGKVSVIERNLNGIELDVDLDCRRLINEKLIPQN